MTKRSAFTNSAINALGSLLPVALTLFTAPLYLQYIGTSRYGVLAVVWIFLGYLGFMDLGVSRASENALGKIASVSNRERGLVLVTSGYLNLALGLIGSAILLAGGKIAVHMDLISSAELSKEFNSAIPWIAAIFPLSLIGGVGIGSIESRENFVSSNLLGILDSTLGTTIPVLAAVFIGPSLAIIVPAVVFAKMVSLAMVSYVVIRDEGPLDFRSFDTSRGKSLFGYGIWISVTNVISPILTSIDQILIGSVLGPAAVAHYNIPMSLASRTQVLAVSLARSLFPRLSRMDNDAAIVLVHRSTLTLSYLVAAVCGPAIIASDQFFRIWLGSDFAQLASPVAKILMLGAWINSVAFLSFSFLQAQGRPDIVAKVHFVEVIPYVGTLWWLLTSFGLTGAAIAWCIRAFVDTLILLWIVEFRSIQYLSLAPAGFLLICTYLLSFHMSSGNTFESVLVSLGVGALALGLGLLRDPTLKSLMLGISRRSRVV